MTTHLDAHTLPTSPTSRPSALLSLTRVLAAAHGLLGVLGIGYAIYAVLAYQEAGPDETFAGLLLFFGAGAALIGIILVVLGAGAVMTRKPAATYALGLSAGLFLVAVTVPASYLVFSYAGAAVGALALSLTLCSVIGLARRES